LFFIGMADEEQIGERELWEEMSAWNLLYPDEPDKSALLALDNLRLVVSNPALALGFVVWDATPPSGCGYLSHKLTFLDAVETAFAFLHTDFRDEKLLLGPLTIAVVRTLPQFNEEEPIGTDECIYLGKLSRKKVYANPRMEDPRQWYAIKGGFYVTGIMQGGPNVFTPQRFPGR
jgi:hypothetical protein